nr:hypothetical protein [uncultured Mediterranean phage uvMED]
MALNLSTLTSPATSGDVLAEALTTADLLEGVPVLRNLARGSQKGGDAKQSVSLNQPRALPLIKNPSGNLGGYLYIPDVTGNYATGPSVTIGSNQTWEAEVDMVITRFQDHIIPLGGGVWNSGFGLMFANNTNVYVFSKGVHGSALSGVVVGQPFTVKYGFDGTNVFCDINAVRKVTQTATGQSGSITHPLQIDQQAGIAHAGNYAIQKAKLTVNSAVVFDCDFNGSTSIRHGDTKFKAAVGGFVSIASPELLINGNFDTDTAWTKGAGWTIADGVATLASTPNSSQLTSTAIAVTAGKTYKIVVNVIATSGSFRLYDTAGVVSYYLSVGENVYSRVATGSTYQVIPLSLGSGTATIDSISVTEVSPDAKRDPITVVKKDILRFDGVNDGLKGLFGQTITEGYMFAAFSVLGDGGEAWGRIISVNKTGGSNDYTGGGMIFAYRSGSTNNLATYKGFLSEHVGLFDSSNGDILSEAKATQSATLSRVNNADEKTTSNSYTIEGDEFNIGQGATGLENAAIDLEYLALFSVDSVPDEATASKIRNYINSRNQIYLRHQTDGYYFYDAQNAPVGNISSGSSAWSGRIVGSDNGDSASIEATQATANDQPVGDGYVVTFADNSDHLDIPSTSQAGWQVVGTSLGTFVYRINGTTAVTELNLLGNAGAIRSIGDLYGIILLPASATGKDIEDARKLLIDRGASDGATVSSYQTAWYLRSDITEFKSVNMTGVTNVESAWNLSGLISFSTPLPSATNAKFAWYNNTSLSEFTTTDIKNGTDFTGAWQGCSALTSFPAGAKLGTSANNVNFTSAWESSGLNSFSTPLPTATSVNTAWRFCSNLTSFNSDLSSTTDVRSAWRATGLTSFNTPLPKAANVFIAFFDCTALTDFSLDVFANWNPSSLASGVFNLTWNGCTSLTAQSVENILVPIDASGKYATTNGVSDGTALADAGIDIDYNGDPLSAATNSAVTSLKAKGWSIIVNNVTL